MKKWKRETIRRFEEWQPPKLSKRDIMTKDTIDFLEGYLDPASEWAREMTPQQKINMIIVSDVDWEVVKKHIEDMPKEKFLHTLLWKALFEYISGSEYEGFK